MPVEETFADERVGGRLRETGVVPFRPKTIAFEDKEALLK
jgi:hypothetical protein